MQRYLGHREPISALGVFTFSEPVFASSEIAYIEAPRRESLTLLEPLASRVVIGKRNRTRL